jgi:hypothetical protein
MWFRRKIQKMPWSELMSSYMVVIYTPVRQAMLGPTREKYEVRIIEAGSLDQAISQFSIPLDGTAYVTDMENVTTLKSRMIIERIKDAAR